MPNRSCRSRPSITACASITMVPEPTSPWQTPNPKRLTLMYLSPGKAIQTQQFPDWNFTDETYLLGCLLHDIGTTDKNLPTTLMSFEFYGGLLALELLQKDHHAPKAQAESVCEAIIRHQDLGESGKITTLGLLIQLATVFGGSSHFFIFPRLVIGNRVAE